jgi:hypothetical protein
MQSTVWMVPFAIMSSSDRRRHRVEKTMPLTWTAAIMSKTNWLIAVVAGLLAVHLIADLLILEWLPLDADDALRMAAAAVPLSQAGLLALWSPPALEEG